MLAHGIAKVYPSTKYKDLRRRDRSKADCIEEASVRLAQVVKGIDQN
jgi:hypothetical protein